MSMQHGKLVLKNYMLNTLIELLNVPVAGQVARARNRFILRLNDQAHNLEERRMKLIKEFGVIDEVTKEPKIKPSGEYELKDAPAFEAAFKAQSDESYELPCVAEQLVDFQTVHSMLENSTVPLSIAQTTIYDEVLQAFEAWVAAEKQPKE